MRSSARIGERGQVVIPKPLRERFGLKPRTEVEFRVVRNQLVLHKKAPKAQPHPVGRPVQEELRRTGPVRGRVHRAGAGSVITAVDSNVLLDILRPNAEWAQASLAALEEASDCGVPRYL
jgi:AbrB family looped-hinge helix DNA binding protein